MEETKKNLELRKKIKKKKPNFIRQDIHKKSKLKKKWRRPKGIQSKIRLGKKGKRKKVAAGYGSPRDVRGLSREGFIPVIVKNSLDMKGLDNKKHAVLISSGVGKRKKISLLEEAKKLSLNILNAKDADSLINKIKEEVKARKEKRKKKKTKKEEKSKKALSKKEKEEKKEAKKESEMTEKEKKEEEKKEKDDVLIHAEH